MLANKVAENVLGTIGTILWSGQIIPQIIKSWREKSTEGLSGTLMFTWATSAVFLGVYAIVHNLNIPLIIQPQLFGFLAATSWTQCLYYGRRLPARHCALILAVYSAIFAGFEAGMTFVVRDAANRGNDRPLQFFGAFSAILISIALIPQYMEIYRLKEVIGISMVFLSIDMLGGFFSLLSLIFRPKFDTVASISYIAVIVLDGVIVVCRFILNPRARRRREHLALEAAASVAPGPSSITAPTTSSTEDGLEQNTATSGTVVIAASRPPSENKDEQLLSEKTSNSGPPHHLEP